MGIDNEIGSIGINHHGGYLYEEWNKQLAGREAKVFREMLDNVGVLGGWFNLVELMMRAVPLRVDAGRDTPSAQAERDRIDESLHDMRTPVRTITGEGASGLPFGFVAWEKTYKIRRGANDNRSLNSKYADGRIGWGDWSLRAQETIERFEFDSFDEWAAMVQQHPATFAQVTIPREKLVHFVPMSWKRSPVGRSMLRSVYRIYKLLLGHEEKEAVGADKNLAGMVYAELPIEYFGPNVSPALRAIRTEIETNIAKFRSGAYSSLTFPAEEDSVGQKTGMKLNQFEGARASFNSHQVIQRLEGRLLICVLADILIMGQDVGHSHALGKVKDNLLEVAMGSVLDGMCEIMTEEAAILSTLNGVPVEDHSIITHVGLDVPELTHMANYVGQILGIDPSRLNPILREHLEQEARLPAGSFAAPAEDEAEATEPVEDDPSPDDDGDDEGAANDDDSEETDEVAA